MHRPVLAVAAALVVLLSGCTEQSGGSPVAEGGSTGTPSITTEPDEPTQETSETTEPSDGGLADVDPCGLVDAAGLSALGLTGGEEKTLGQARVCRYRHDGPTLNESFTVSVEIFDDVGVEDIVGTDVKQLPKIGSHDASSFISPAGGCAISIGVGDGRVDNTAVGGAQQQGCQLVAQLAAHVEPKLP